MTALARTHQQEPEPSRELVVVEGDGMPTAADFERAEAALAALREAGDLEGLHDVASRADVFLHHFRKVQASREIINAAGRVKVLAEAEIGQLDRERSPRRSCGRSNAEPLVIGGLTVASWTRNRWRLLAIAKERGALDSIFENLTSDPDAEISSRAVFDQTKALGVGWVNPAPLEAAIKKSGKSRREIARQVGAGQPLRPGGIMTYDRALAYARVLDVDPASLPMARAQWSKHAISEAHARRRAQREALRREDRAKAARSHGGNIAEAFSLLRKCAQVLDPAEHDFSTREAKAHVRSAYGYLRKAEDEIAQALGVA